MTDPNIIHPETAGRIGSNPDTRPVFRRNLLRETTESHGSRLTRRYWVCSGETPID